jgi:hypothetical protein
MEIVYGIDLVGGLYNLDDKFNREFAIGEAGQPQDAGCVGCS